MTIGAGEASRAGLVQDLQMQPETWVVGGVGVGLVEKIRASGSNKMRLGGGEGKKRQMTL